MTKKGTEWTPEALIRYPAIREIALSTDGELIAYAVREALMTEERSEEIAHLYAVSAAGGEPIRLTYGSWVDRAPRISETSRSARYTFSSASTMAWDATETARACFSV